MAQPKSTNYLGVDHGSRRTGLSIFHGAVGIVLPMAAAVGDGEATVNKICDAVRQNDVSAVVVGYPLLVDGSVGSAAKEVDRFIEKLRRRLPSAVEIHRADERLTSEGAEHAIAAAHGHRSHARLKKMRSAGVIDSQAAVLILRDFLGSTAV
jgi:putative Holliday junction resolvase